MSRLFDKIMASAIALALSLTLAPLSGFAATPDDSALATTADNTLFWRA